MPLCLCLLFFACTDPRARPVPPQLVLQFPVGLEINSPGQLPHTLFVYDADGLDGVRIRVFSGDSALDVDSSFVPFDLFQANVSFNWAVPAGIPAGTPIHVVARVTDLVGFATSDSVAFTVQDTTAAGANRP